MDNILTEITESDKQLLISGQCTILTKVIVKDYNDDGDLILTEKDSVKTWDVEESRYVPDVGFVGQFIARELSGELQNITDTFNIQDKTVTILMGITQYESTQTTWYSLGDFIIDEPKEDDVDDNTKYSGFDLTVLFNKDFDASYTSTNFPKSFETTIAEHGYFTALELSNYTCEQVGVEFGSTSFPGDSFKIDSNQFTEGNSCRNVMQNISKIPFGWVAIHWDNKCYIDYPSVDYENISNEDILTNDNYYSLSLQKTPYGPVNRIYVGYEDIQGEGVSRDTTDETLLSYPVTELSAYDNPITYTDTLRREVLDFGEHSFGLTYTPIEMETPGHPWFKAHNPIKVQTMDGTTIYTYPFVMTISYTGHIKTKISSEAKTNNQNNYGYKDSLYKDLKKVGILVDKQQGTIETIVSNQTASDDRLSAVETQYYSLITDTYRKDEINNIISGVGVDGRKVTYVVTEQGVFDKDGLLINKTQTVDNEETQKSETKTRFNEIGMRVYDMRGETDPNADGPTILFAGFNKENGQTLVEAQNMSLSEYLHIGNNSRYEDYIGFPYAEQQSELHEGTGVYYIGSDRF